MSVALQITDLSRVLIVDDHPMFRVALSSAIKTVYSSAETKEASSIEEASDLLDRDRNFDIALLDLNIPGVNGFDGLMRLRAEHPRLPILVVSGLENKEIIEEALRYGAAGFLPKSQGGDVLAQALETVLQGGIFCPANIDQSHDAMPEEVKQKALLIERVLSLTPQQLKVLYMLREGLLNKQIAHELDVGSSTVKKHVSEILRKLSVYSRTQAVIEVSKLDQSEMTDIDSHFRSQICNHSAKKPT